MKKITLIFLISLISFSVFAENPHTIMFADSIVENGVYNKSDIWIADKIKVNLISALQRYGNFKCVDLNEARNILKIQNQLGDVIYDDSQSIKIGKLIKAKEVVNIKSTRFPSGAYSISITIINVETGEIIGMFSSPKSYESAESYTIQAHLDCLEDILKRLGINLTSKDSDSIQEEKKTASSQAEKNKQIAKENEKIEAQRSKEQREEAERIAKLAQEERERQEAKAKAEALAAKKELEAKKAREAEAYAKAKQQNPFAYETYVYEFENGSRYDTYKIKFTSKNDCTVTVTSIDSKGNEKNVTKDGSYSYENDILSINVRMQNQEVKHVQKIQWKGQVSFKNGYKIFYFMIPVSSNEDAKKVRAEFQKKS